MNSRFKFRVWDTKDKKYKPCAIFCDGEAAQEHDRYIIEQSTGLQDRNGKLIYEGDVICRDNGRWKEIRFHQGGFGWWTEYHDFVCFSGHIHIKDILQTHKIIGNIHEMGRKRKQSCKNCDYYDGSGEIPFCTYRMVNNPLRKCDFWREIVKL